MYRPYHKNSRTSRIVEEVEDGSDGVRTRNERDLNEEGIRNYEDVAKMERNN